MADILVGLLRLRKISDQVFRPEMLGKRCSIVRELHVYGSAVPLAARDPTKFQHQGYGTLLMEEAERIGRKDTPTSPYCGCGFYLSVFCIIFLAILNYFSYSEHTPRTH